MTGEGQPADTTRLGHLLGPHGVQGGVKLYLLGDPAQVTALRRVFVEGKGWLRLRKTEPLAPGLVLHLIGVSTREAAQELRGLKVYAADSELPPLEEGHYYYHELRGLPVLDSTGRTLGTVEEVEDAGYQDLLVVRDAARQSFVPLQAPYVVIEQAGGKPTLVRLTDDAPEGLLGEDDGESDR
ncbi:ribosome maturation factor RimM [Deinococcus fonticola]|uniref:ribosome maturation factor RimM n=1 Tax=Deinococcus fonticola TaxID=2528713 RepID=UPI001075542B|nr:ribosome maturation factor RimM [Deinococcus fonticola]